MKVTEKELAEIRRELERQERELTALEAAAIQHRGIELHIADHVQEQLDTITTSLKRKPAAPTHTFFVRA
jgi:hypothetical protein